jgi:hypothetical protein
MFEALFGPMHLLVLFFFLVVGGVSFVILRVLWKETRSKANTGQADHRR